MFELFWLLCSFPPTWLSIWKWFKVTWLGDRYGVLIAYTEAKACIHFHNGFHSPCHLYSGLICLHSGLKTEIESDDDDLHNICLRRTSIYRVSRVKLENCKLLFQTENMDRFLIKWYFYYRKGGKFYMVPQQFRKKNLCQSQISNFEIAVFF